MTARRRMVVAFIEVETPQDRAWRHMSLGLSADDLLAEGRRPIPKPYYDRGHTPEGRARYWCAADKPEEGYDFKLAPIHRTTKVPANAECEDCGIRLRDLQAELTHSLGGAS